MDYVPDQKTDSLPGEGVLADRPSPAGPLHESSGFQTAVEASAPISSRDRANDGSLIGFLSRTLIVLIVIATLRFTAPVIVEEIQYALTRGRQRAEFETAGQYLQSTELGQLSGAYQMVSQRVWPSVVHINVLIQGAAVANNRARILPLPERHMHGQEEHRQGSGVIVDSNGYVLTNYHVVADASDIDVALSDGRRVAGELVGFDVLTDLAVVKISANQLIAAQWGDSDRIREGALVWAVGSPFGLERSITSGILSAKNRAGVGRIYQDFLQTDAAVNRGNSGGPLVDASGSVIGINTMIAGETFLGISFAVPSSVAKEVYEKLVVEGHVARGWLGVGLESVSRNTASPSEDEPLVGARVISLVDQAVGSPAREAGLRKGDIVVRWNDQVIDSPTTLIRAVAHTAIGTQAEVQVIRDGKEMATQVRVAERPDEVD